MRRKRLVAVASASFLFLVALLAVVLTLSRESTSAQGVETPEQTAFLRGLPDDIKVDKRISKEVTSVVIAVPNDHPDLDRIRSEFEELESRTASERWPSPEILTSEISSLGCEEPNSSGESTASDWEKSPFSPNSYVANFHSGIAQPRPAPENTVATWLYCQLYQYALGQLSASPGTGYGEHFVEDTMSGDVWWQTSGAASCSSVCTIFQWANPSSPNYRIWGLRSTWTNFHFYVSSSCNY